jgi:transposase InsO family protein
MKFAFIERNRQAHPIRVMCTVLEVSASGYYRWRQQPVSDRQREDRRLRVEIGSIFRASRQTYGRPRMHRALRDRGIRCGQARVVRLMRHDGLRAKKARRFRQTTRAAASRPTAPNVLDRGFTVAAPNIAWAGDITYLWTEQGWLYLAVMLDLYSRRVIGWATAERLTESLAHAALQRALAERHVGTELVHHTDRGSQYTSASYQRLLRTHGLTVSMSRKGNCWDNAVVESFFATLKVELGERFPSRALAHDALFEYIEIFYNRARMHSSIGFISPAEAEARFENEAAA